MYRQCYHSCLQNISAISYPELPKTKQGYYNVSLMPTFPTRRCTVYTELALSRKEGAALCKEMGWGLQRPLSPQQIKILDYLSKQLAEWKSRDLSFQSFIDYYLPELMQDAQQKNTPTTSGKPYRP
jgi:hypothetical protein